MVYFPPDRYGVVPQKNQMVNGWLALRVYPMNPVEAQAVQSVVQSVLAQETSLLVGFQKNRAAALWQHYQPSTLRCG